MECVFYSQLRWTVESKTLKVGTTAVKHARAAKREALWQWKQAGKPLDTDNSVNIRSKETNYSRRWQIGMESAKQPKKELKCVMNAKYNDKKLFYHLIKNSNRMLPNILRNAELMISAMIWMIYRMVRNIFHSSLHQIQKIVWTI